MRIRRLELCGFKSFPERTVFQFAEGISGVVGPNGCGKSNVLDAIRWLLGEQNARLLRGQGMEDVIFGGSSARSATGLAEATLVLDNREGTLGDRYARFAEVEVSRRLYRDGESRYLINGARCRLKDVTTLFMDTGVGARASSVIEQGRVVDLINSKPSDRRVLLEEAAGIVGYKSRRQEAQRRLEATEQNLLRVGDLADELRRQAGSLRRQASKANRYRSLQATRKETEVLLTLAEAREQTDRFREWMERLTDLRARRDVLVEDAKTTEVQVEAQRAERRNAAAAVDEIKERQAHLRADLHTQEREREFAQREIGQLRARAETLGEESQGAQRRSRQLADELTRLEDEATLRRDELAQHREALEQSEREARDTDGALGTLQSELTTTRADEERAVTGVARLHAELDSVDRRRQEHGERLSNLDRERADAEGRVEAARARHAEVAAALEKLDAEVHERRTHLVEVQEEREGRHGAWAAMMVSLEELTGLVRDREARRQSLAEVLDRFEGFDRGVREVMKRRDADNGSSGILGTVADVLEVSAQYEQAIEAALGDALQCVLVESRRHGLSAIGDLKERNAGRTSFVPLAALRPADAEGEASDHEAVLGTVREVVRVQERFAGVADHLIGDALLVESLEDAVRVWDQDGEGRRLVTLDGEVVDANGVVTGGGQLDGGVLGQKRELRQVEAELADLRAEESEARTTVEAISSALDRLAEDLKATEQVLHELDVRRARLDGDLHTAQRDQDVAARALGDLDRVQQQARVQGKALEERRRQLLTELEQTAIARDAARERRLALEEKLEDQREAREQRRSKAIQARMETSAAEDRLRSAQQRLAHVRDAVEAVTGQLERDRAEQERTRTRIAELEQQIVVLGTTLTDAARALERSGEEVERAIARRDEVLAAGRSLEERMAALRRDRDGLEEQLQESSTQVALLENELDHLRAGLAEGFDLDLREVFSRLERDHEVELTLRGTLPRPLGEGDDEAEDPAGADVPGGPGAADVAPPVASSPESDAEASVVAQADEEVITAGIVVHFHWDQLLDDDDLARRRDELQQTRRALERIGEINMAAPEAYQRVKAKHDELRTQMGDLEASIDRIHKGILKLNRTSRDRFGEAFAEVDAHFRALYPRLTGGGQAYLALTDPDDLLETGLEIHVQPPGKKLKAMGLLSGGEKAMAAIALLFAVFLYRPSPFCLLDEVDAELDEANVRRYNQLLREMSQRTQFIVITHKRQTMETSDVLFGITMEKPGVSKLVTVRLEEI